MPETPTAKPVAPAISVNGYVWTPRAYEPRHAQAISQQQDVPPVVGELLAARGVTPETAADFLRPALRTQLPDPMHLKDMEIAAERVARAVETRERIAVFGDYDVDGATSTALLVRFLRTLGSEAVTYIPDRMSEGYGPNPKAMRKLAGEMGCSLILTVDCGISAHEALAAARDAGADVVVVDHHIGAPELPPACAVVNPNRFDETSPHGYMAAVGVTFLLVVAVNSVLRTRGWYDAYRP